MSDSEILRENVAVIALGLGWHAKNSRVIFAKSIDRRPRDVRFTLSAAEHFANAQKSPTFHYLLQCLRVDRSGGV
jgi:hypothetical protein